MLPLLKIQCIDKNMYRIAQKYFNKTNTEFRSFSLPNDRTLKMVIKALLPDLLAAEVVEEHLKASK